MGEPMSRWDAWSDGYMAGVRVGRWQVDFRYGRDPWLPLFVREGRTDGFGRVVSFGSLGVLTFGKMRKPKQFAAGDYPVQGHPEWGPS